jgi:hypothetical protein
VALGCSFELGRASYLVEYKTFHDKDKMLEILNRAKKIALGGLDLAKGK